MIERPASPDSAVSAVYQLRIELRDTAPPVWRRIEVPSAMNLAEVHRVFQIAMGWTDAHQHEFDIGDVLYGNPDADEAEEATELFVESAVTLAEVAIAGDTWRYLYDFGDAWDHDVAVEAVLAGEAGVTYPRCTAGERACPPEDVLGSFGYQDFLIALANPAHPDHAAGLQFAPGFDPEAFDLAAVNAALSAPPEPPEPEPEAVEPRTRPGRHRRN